MKYYINSETMGVKWMESIFTVFKGHGESLLCQSPWERERGEYLPLNLEKNKSQRLIKEQDTGMDQNEAVNSVCSRRSCIHETVSKKDPAFGLCCAIQDAEHRQKAAHSRSMLTKAPAA